MPSFDIVSKVDVQKLDNAINTATKEILNRYDFHGSKTEIDLDMHMDAIRDIIISRANKQGIEPGSFDFGKEHQAAGAMLRKEVKVMQGIDKEVGKKIVKVIKDSGLKVQASIMDEQVRVTGKKIDDLQAAIAIVRQADIGQPLQFDNFRN